jgi:hypothetical protein
LASNRSSCGWSDRPLAVSTAHAVPLPGPFNRLPALTREPPEGQGLSAAPPLPTPFGSQ